MIVDESSSVRGALRRIASASVSRPSISTRSSTRVPSSVFSKSTPRTTWARAVRRIVGSRRSANAIRCRCTASACRSARPVRSTAPILPGSPRSRNAIEPALVSEHLAWSTHEGAFFNDLLPLPYTDETLARSASISTRSRTRSGGRCCSKTPRPMSLFAESTMGETDFLREIARRTGCGLLLDVNNIFVSADQSRLRRLSAISRDFPLAAVGRDPSRRLRRRPLTTRACRCSSTPTIRRFATPSGRFTPRRSGGSGRRRP